MEGSPSTAVKQAIREVLRSKNRPEIMLKDDRTQQKPRLGRILGSQQSKIPELQLFATSDGSLWLDHFYDDIAGNILNHEHVQGALRMNMDKAENAQFDGASTSNERSDSKVHASYDASSASFQVSKPHLMG